MAFSNEIYDIGMMYEQKFNNIDNEDKNNKKL